MKTLLRESAGILPTIPSARKPANTGHRNGTSGAPTVATFSAQKIAHHPEQAVEDIFPRIDTPGDIVVQSLLRPMQHPTINAPQRIALPATAGIALMTQPGPGRVSPSHGLPKTH
jgi:hypothetical protein